MSKLISQKHRHAYAKQSVIMPVIGEVQFNEDGSLDVADEKVEDFIAATKESFDFQPEGKSKKKGGKKDGEDDEETDEVKEWRAQLAKATTKDLLAMAKEADLGTPEKVAAMTDEKLREELLKKLTAPAKK